MHVYFTRNLKIINVNCVDGYVFGIVFDKYILNHCFRFKHEEECICFTKMLIFFFFCAYHCQFLSGILYFRG